MTNRRNPLAATLVALSLGLLAACGGDDDSSDTTSAAEEAVESVTGDNDAELKGDSPLDAAGYAIVSVQSEKYSDYEIDGDTVRLSVRSGVTLAGSECTIIDAATSTDYPDVTFVLVEEDGQETTC